MPNSADGAAGSKIFVGGLDRSVDEGVVRSFFQQFGPVVEVRIVVNVSRHRFVQETSLSRSIRFL